MRVRRSIGAGFAALLVALGLAPAAGAAARLYVPDYFFENGVSVSGYERDRDGLLSPLPGSPFDVAPIEPETVSGVIAFAFAPDGNRAVSTYLFEGGVAAAALTADGSAALHGEAIETPSATSLAVSPDGAVAYVPTREFGSPAQGILGYSIAADGTLTPIGSFGGATEVGDVAITPDGRFLFAGDYASGEIRRFAIEPGGALTELGPPTAGPSPVAWLVPSPDGRFLFGALVGAADGVVSFAIGADGSLSQNGPPALTGDAASGIFDVSPDGRFVYMPDSNADAIVTAAVAPGGALTVVGSTPVEEVESVAVSPDGRFLYYNITGEPGEIGLAAIGPDGIPVPLGKSAPWNSGPVTVRMVFQPGGAPTAAFTVAPPPIPLAGGAAANVGTQLGFDATASIGAARFEWDFGDGTVLADGGPAPAHAYAAPRDFPVRLTVYDEQGCSTRYLYSGQSFRCPGSPGATTATSVRVVAPPAPPANAAPKLKALRAKPKRFAATGKKGKKGGAKRFTTLRYWLSEPATVTFTVRRKVIGRKVGGRCVRRTKGNRKRKACALRYRYVGNFRRGGEQGGNADRFAGKVRRGSKRKVRLSPGVHRLTAVATDPEGASSAPRSTWFRVVRP